jgi:hypothetical protein
VAVLSRWRARVSRLNTRGPCHPGLSRAWYRIAGADHRRRRRAGAARSPANRAGRAGSTCPPEPGAGPPCLDARTELARRDRAVQPRPNCLVSRSNEQAVSFEELFTARASAAYMSFLVTTNSTFDRSQRRNASTGSAPAFNCSATIRRWCGKFGESLAKRLRRRRPRPGDK